MLGVTVYALQKRRRGLRIFESLLKGPTSRRWKTWTSHPGQCWSRSPSVHGWFSGQEGLDLCWTGSQETRSTWDCTWVSLSWTPAHGEIASHYCHSRENVSTHALYEEGVGLNIWWFLTPLAFQGNSIRNKRLCLLYMLRLFLLTHLFQGLMKEATVAPARHRMRLGSHPHHTKDGFRKQTQWSILKPLSPVRLTNFRPWLRNSWDHPSQHHTAVTPREAPPPLLPPLGQHLLHPGFTLLGSRSSPNSMSNTGRLEACPSGQSQRKRNMFKHPVIIITTDDNKRNNEQELLVLNKSGKCTLQHVPGALKAGTVLQLARLSATREFLSNYLSPHSRSGLIS